MAFNISGTVFSDAGSSPLLAGVTINVSVNGAASAGNTTSSVVDGTYTITNITAAAGAVLSIYIQDGVNPEKAVAVTTSTDSNMTGIDLYQNYLLLRGDNAGTLTHANVATSDNNADTGLSDVYACTTTLTVKSGYNLLINAGTNFSTAASRPVTLTAGNMTINGTFTPGSASTLTLSSGNLTINGTYTQASTACNLTGNYTNNGTHSAVTGTLTCQGAVSKTIQWGPSTALSLTVNASGGTYTMLSHVATTRNLIVPAGTLDSNGFNITQSGGSVQVTGGTLLLSTGTHTLLTLTMTGGVLTGGSSNLAISGNCGCTTAGSFTAPSGTFTVGGSWRAGSGLTFEPGTGTVTLNGGSQTIGDSSTTFYNLVKTVAAAATLTFTDGTTQTISNSLTLQGAEGQLLTLAGSGSAGWNISAPATQTLAYLSVSRSTNSGTVAAAGATSTDGGNNSGWTFGVAASGYIQRTLLGVG